MTAITTHNLTSLSLSLSLFSLCVCSKLFIILRCLSIRLNLQNIYLCFSVYEHIVAWNQKQTALNNLFIYKLDVECYNSIFVAAKSVISRRSIELTHFISAGYFLFILLCELAINKILWFASMIFIFKDSQLSFC